MSSVGLHDRPAGAARSSRVVGAVTTTVKYNSGLDRPARDIACGRLARVVTVTEGAATVRDNPAAHRYELHLDGELVGELVYRVQEDAVILIHTEIAEGLEGRGLGEQLVAAALADVRERGLRAVPLCPFVAAFIRRHPEFEALVHRREAG
jgi:predicted GNAT family acetyltransferase